MKKIYILILFISIYLISCGNIGDTKSPITINNTNNSSTLSDTESEILLASSNDYFNYYDMELKQTFGSSISSLKDCPGTTTFNSPFYNITNLLYSYTLNKWIIYIPKYQKMYQGEHSVGNFFTDAMLYYCKTKLFQQTQIFIQNSGGVRMDKFSKTECEYDADYDADPTKNKHSKSMYLVLGDTFTLNDQSKIAYYFNYNVILKLTPEMLKDALEHSVSSYPSDYWGSGARAQVAGLKAEIDTTAKAGIGGDRVKKIWLYTDFNDTLVWDYYKHNDKWDTIYNSDNGGWQNSWGDTTFYVGMPNYIANGGNDYSVFLAAQSINGIYAQSNLEQKYCMPYMISKYKQITGKNSIVFPIRNNFIFK